MVDSPDINYASFKYAEKIKFQGRCKGKYAIAFGLNPAMADLEKIDYTNNRISFLYNEGYKGYYLLNLYPDIQQNNFRKNISNFSDYYTIAFPLLKKMILTHTFSGARHFI